MRQTERPTFYHRAADLASLAVGLCVAVTAFAGILTAVVAFAPHN